MKIDLDEFNSRITPLYNKIYADKTVNEVFGNKMKEINEKINNVSPINSVLLINSNFKFENSKYTFIIILL